MKRSNYESLQNEINKLYVLIETKLTEGHISERVASTITKQINQVRKYAKHKHRVKKSESNSESFSGLQKPMVVTNDMAKFAKWEPNELHSRVDVTKVLCEYIKQHDLQNPENRRQILLDSTLKTLLKYDQASLTYPHMQKYLKVLFE
jgi:chromatin remodeling complex protein RSC6